jgi:two-component system, chemotaxis family, sensor kinase CheA
MEDIFQKFKKQFINEIIGLLESLETDLLTLENQPDSSQHIDSVFRAMHTIKGTSAMYGCKHISDFTHQLESIFQYIRDTKTRADKKIIDISLVSLDHIRNLINDENLSDPENIARNKELLDEINTYSSSGKTADDTPAAGASSVKPDEKLQSWYILLKTDEQIYFRGISLVNILSDLLSLGTYHIHRIPALSDKDAETWGIVLITSSGIEDIRNVFLFIEDNCTFVLLKDGDLSHVDNMQNFTEMQASMIASPKTGSLPIIEEEVKTVIKTPAEVHTTKEPPRTPVKSKTSLLIAETAKQNLKRITVDAPKLDYLMYLVSELITLNSQLLETTRDDYYADIRPQIEKMESLTKLFRTNALEIRLVPLNDMVVRFQRLIRDLSRQLNKEIDFVTQGTDTELDKNTIDLLSEPIIHIIRNCIDHGIEPVEQRIKKGKNETGIIKLSANHVGNYIQITIEDDGAGLDLEKIRNKAIDKGIIKPNDNLSKNELCNLIFHSGLSTSENITDISGRGVGMDVVKRKITEMRGEIQIETEKDRGTSFILKIQQSIAIIDTLLFRVQKTFFILPLTDIEICIHTDKNELIKNRNTGTIEYNKQMVPVIDLREYFHLGGTYPERVKTIILKEGGQYIGLLSDEIIGEQQAVLKPLGLAYESHAGILAVSQHGNGQWAYMLGAHHLHKTLKSMVNQNQNNISIS